MPGGPPLSEDELAFADAPSAPVQTTSPLGAVSVVLGSIALVGHICCCIPIVSYAADFLIPLLEVATLVTGVMAYQEAKASGEDATLPMVGIGLGIGAVCVTLLYLLVVLGLMAAILLFVGGAAAYQ